MTHTAILGIKPMNTSVSSLIYTLFPYPYKNNLSSLHSLLFTDNNIQTCFFKEEKKKKPEVSEANKVFS